MIPNEILQQVDTLGQTAVVSDFRITTATQARVLMTLSDKMYTRKQLAVLREYSTNAADAHVMVGKPISDIQVSLPTLEDLNFRIRDFGTGLTEAEIKNVYCVLGESTKRNSDDFNGVLGYGCKAGFADADSFTITSWINGTKTIYQAIKGDSTKLHTSIRLCQEESSEPSGIEICVPIRQNAQYTYHREAMDFYRHWPVLPTIKNLNEEDTQTLNAYRTTPATLKGNGWEVRPVVDSARGTAYMGYVPYQIDWDVLYHKMSLDAKTRCLFELIKSNDVTLTFKMGEVNFADSREQLEYTDKTFLALSTRITEIFGKIQDALQDKFVGLPSIWDAKIMYNAIFGTGVLEVEKNEHPDVTEKIKILDGNLLKLEQTFANAFTWNGIVINGPSFTDINRFDNADPSQVWPTGNEPTAPVMVTYRKKKSRVKSIRCDEDTGNKILASSKVAVVINDTGRKTGQQMVGRYLIFAKQYAAVHVLTFETNTLKDLFFKTYAFDTVPTIKLSEILPEAKTWNSANKVHRNYGGGGVRPMKYLDLDLGTIEESEVPVREIEDGGYYLIEIPQMGSRRRRSRHTTKVRGHGNYTEHDAEEIIDNIKIVCESLDLDVDRVYLINTKTSETKWFQEALATGEWLPLWKTIQESLPNITMDIDTMVDAVNYESTTKVSEEVAKQLVPLILEKNSPILKFISTVSGHDYKEYIKVKDAFATIGMWNIMRGEHTGTIDFKSAEEAARSSYPYLPWSEMRYCGNETDFKKLVTYINSMDLYVDLTRDTTPKVVEVQPELIAA